MPAFKLTTRLFIPNKIDEVLLKLIKDQSENDDLCKQLLGLLHVENAREQIESLKQCLKEIRVRNDSLSVSDEKISLSLEYLVHLFFTATTKNPCRRLLISFFNGFSSEYQSAAIVPLIIAALLKLFTQPVQLSTHNASVPNLDQEQASEFGHNDVKTSDLRHTVDTVSALLDNFPLGEICLSRVSLQTLSYLSHVQKYFFTLYSQDQSPVQQNETMHHCLETVKVINRVTQRSSPWLHKSLTDETERVLYVKTASSLLQIDMDILKMDDFLLDCKTTSAMNICLMLKFVLTEEQVLNFFAQTLFQHIGWFKQLHICKDLPDWLLTLNLDQLARGTLTDSAYLSCCFGVLSMVSMGMLSKCFDGKCLLLDILLDEFLLLSKWCSGVGSKLLAAKSVLFFTQRLRTSCREMKDCVELLPRLRGDGDDMKKILNFIWTSWEDSAEAVRFTVKDVFNNVVSLHVSVTQSDNVEPDPFLLSLSRSILTDVSWACKGKYGTLAILIDHLGSARMLQMHAGIAGEVLNQLQEQTLACYASGLYESLFKRHLVEIGGTTSPNDSTDVPGIRQWLEQWVKPVLGVLCAEDAVHKKHVMEYILPKLLKTGEVTLSYMLKCQTDMLQLSYLPEGDPIMKTFSKENQLGALIMVLRRARALGLLNKISSSNHKHKSVMIDGSTGNHTMNKTSDTTVEAGIQYDGINKETDQSKSSIQLWGVVDMALIEQALVCRDEQVRQGGFALLCENQKTTDPVSDEELGLVLRFILQNLNNQNPAFRQHFLSLLKKFLCRLKESSLTLKKLAKKSKDAQKHLDMYKTMLEDLTKGLFSNLYPGSVFARRTTCLGALRLLKEVYGPAEQHGTGYCFNSLLSSTNINCLLLCLTDTFDDNKLDAANILMSDSVTAKGNRNMDQPLVEELTQIAVSLSQSSRPQDGATAAYMFKVLLHQADITAVLDKMMTQQQLSGKKDTCTDLTNKEESYPLASCYQSNPRTDTLLKESSIEITDTRGLAEVMEQNELRSGLADVCLLEPEKDDMSSRQLRLLWLLLLNLEDQTRVASSSLMVAAANRPLYPTLQCIRCGLAEVDFRNMDNPASLNKFLTRFISLCFTISGVVSPVVHNSSPEGNVPVAEVEGDGDLSNLASEEEVSRSRETIMLMPEYLVVCCWRSIKEVSLVLGQLTSRIPVLDLGHALLTVSQILEIGDYFTIQLLESVHRGAFELAYSGFVMVTDMLWRSSDPQLHRLPAQWLANVMSDIKSGDPGSRLCATRRSAGVPFYVQALVTTEPSSTGRICLKQTMCDLLALAFDESVVSQEKCTPKVHALNILRALYKDSRLKDDVSPYIADGLQVAILGFKAPQWAVRNSATLLMSAMMVRIFGVKRSKDETNFSRKNCQTGRTFFHKYPTLYQFLLTQLQEATEQITSQLHPGLFPILMVLGRLFPSAMEGTDTSLNLAAFIPYVIKCSSSPVLKTRIMASRALQPLVEKDHVTLVFTDLLSLLPCQPVEHFRQNQIHGTLLQIQQMCSVVPSMSPKQLGSLSETVLELWSQRVEAMISRHNRCVLTRAGALIVSSDILRLFGHHKHIEDTLMATLQLEMTDFPHLMYYHPSTPALDQFHTTVCHLYIQNKLPRATSVESMSGHTTGNGSGHVTGNCDQIVVNKAGNPGIKDPMTVNHFADLAEDKIDTSLPSHPVGNVDQTVTIETVLLKLLTARSYEVREMILQELTQVCKSDCLVTVEGTYPDSTAGSELVCSRLRESLLTSENIHKTLLSMTMMEEREECLIQLFSLLAVNAVCQRCHGNNVSQLYQSLLHVTRRVQDSQASEPVTAAVIGYSGTVAQLLYLQIQPNIRDQGFCNENNLQIKDTFTQWTSAIKDHCTGDCGTEVKLACAHALRRIVNSLPAWTRDSDLTCLAFESVLELLHGDDLDVREAAAETVFSLMSMQAGVSLHPYVSVDVLLKHWTQSGCHGNSKVKVVENILKLICDSRERENQDVDERLFDRGEGNTYWDDLDYVKSLDQAFVNHWTGLSMDMNVAADYQLEEAIKRLVNDQVNKHLSDTDAVMKRLKTFDLKYILIYPPSFQQDVIWLYKLLLVVKYGMTISQDDHTVDRCQKFLQLLNNSIQSQYLPSRLRHVIEHISHPQYPNH